MEIGLTHEFEIVVTEQMLASSVGSGLVDAFATPIMIANMEKCASQLVCEHIGVGNVTVGTAVNVSHISATPVGMKVRFKATLTAVDGKMLEFDVVAFDERDKIGEGSHSRAIVNAEKFNQRTASK